MNTWGFIDYLDLCAIAKDLQADDIGSIPYILIIYDTIYSILYVHICKHLCSSSILFHLSCLPHKIVNRQYMVYTGYLPLLDILDISWIL